MEEILEIRLPDDAKLVTRLEAKLEEYRERMRKRVREHDRARDYDTECKIRILAGLLKEKIVRLSDIEREYSADDPRAMPYLYNAFVVIQDYAMTGGKNLSPSHGTGLPGVPSEETAETDKK